MQSASPIVPDASGAPSPALPREPASLSQRIRRFLPYIRHVQRYWIVVLVALIVAVWGLHGGPPRDFEETA